MGYRDDTNVSIQRSKRMMGTLTKIARQEEEPVCNESRGELSSEEIKVGIDLKEDTKPNF